MAHKEDGPPSGHEGKHTCEDIRNGKTTDNKQDSHDGNKSKKKKPFKDSEHKLKIGPEFSPSH